MHDALIARRRLDGRDPPILGRLRQLDRKILIFQRARRRQREWLFDFMLPVGLADVPARLGGPGDGRRAIGGIPFGAPACTQAATVAISTSLRRSSVVSS